MVAIIYYQEITIVSIISILVSLLSVSAKSLIFSPATTVNIFLFNWISIVTDFIGIFCSLSFVFYNYNSNDNDIITEWGYIWIYQSIAMWSIVWVCIVCTCGTLVICEEWYYATRSGHVHLKKVGKITIIVIVASIIFAAVSFLLVTITLFAGVAYVKCF